MSYFKRIFGIVSKCLLKKSGDAQVSTSSAIVDGFVVIMDMVNPLSPVPWKIVKYASPILLNLALAHPYVTLASIVIFTDLPVLTTACQSAKLSYRGVHYLYSRL